LLHDRFLLFNPSDLCHSGPLVEKRVQLIELRGRSRRINLHAAVVFVADPPPYPDVVCILLNEPAKSNTLYSPRDEPSPRLNLSRIQYSDRCRPSGSGFLIASSIADRNAFAVKGLGIRRKPFSTT
jgi:hypothetical protein